MNDFRIITQKQCDGLLRTRAQTVLRTPSEAGVR